jgi:hypothetical protein
MRQIKYFLLISFLKVLVLDAARKKVMNVRGSVLWVINLKDYNNQYYADKPCSKRQYYWMRNK